MEAIKTVNLTKKYNDITAVYNLNLSINSGEIFALLGVNGAGKTTTIKMLSCLTEKTSGDAFLNGHSITSERNKIKEIIGVSPQETAIAPNLSVKENLEFLCGIYGLKGNEKKDRLNKLIDDFNLNDVLNKRACKLSGGYKRRLSIALSLVGNPEILFLDEPTLGLDIIARNELWDVIRELKGKITIILTTHYMEEAEELSDRVAIMKSGKLLTVGTVDEIKNKAGKDKFDDAFVAIVKGDLK